MIFIRPLLLFVLLVIINLAQADSSSKNLQRLQAQIQNLKTNLRQTQLARVDFQSSLQNTETAISKLNNQLRQTKLQLKQQRLVLQQLTKQQAQYQTSLNQQQTILAQQLRSAYILGHQQYLKVLLSQQDPTKISRLLTYYQYFINNRVQIINRLDATLQQLAANKAQIEAHTQQLAALQTKQELENSQLIITKTKREQVLKKLDSEIQTKNQRLNELMANKQALEGVVKRLLFTGKPVFNWPRGKSLMQLRGRLPWPTVGRITEGFNTQLDQSELKLSGVIINAPEGQAVYAIAPGHVVFANWLPGYGLLVIMDHGQGIMTLYGRNDALYKKTGDNVAAGELVATVGRSGGYSKPGLYFAIRQNGIAVDPQAWCRR